MIGNFVGSALVSVSSNWAAWFRQFCRWAKSSFALISRAALFGVLFLFANGEIAMAQNDLTGLKEKLQQLRTATDIVLMIVPYPMSFRVRVDETALAKVSCVYKIMSGRSSFEQVLDIIGSSIIEYVVGPNRGPDLRVGIIFKSDGKILQDFYFDDRGGHYEVNGFSGDRRISAAADLPARLRSLLTSQDVVLIKSGDNECPHS
jgi:hypothetical protein